MTINQIVSIPKGVTFNPASESSSIFSLLPEIIAQIGWKLTVPERAHLCMTSRQGLRVASEMAFHLMGRFGQEKKELLTEMEKLFSSLEKIGLTTTDLRNEILPLIDRMTLNTMESTCQTIDLSILRFFHRLTKEEIDKLYQAKVLQGRALEILEIEVRFREVVKDAPSFSTDNQIVKFCASLVSNEPHLVMEILNLQGDTPYLFDRKEVLACLTYKFIDQNCLVEAVQIAGMATFPLFSNNHDVLVHMICQRQNDEQCVRLARMIPNYMDSVALRLIEEKRTARATEIVRLLPLEHVQRVPIFQKLLTPGSCTIL